jgi:flagellar biosynthesis/type III secretory pathway chaperone
VLQQTEALYQQLLTLIDQEKQAAAGIEVQHLTSVSNEKQAVLAQLKLLDQQLARIMQQVANDRSISRDKLNLSLIAGSAGPPLDDQIRSLNKRLKTLTVQVQRANEECRQLIQHCLRLVHNKLGFFHHWSGAAADVYAASGNIRGPATGGRLVRDMA